MLKFFKNINLGNIIFNLKYSFIINKYFNFTEDKKINIPRNELRKMIEDKENIKKLKVRGSGPGGQHLNKTESTVFLKDLKTNISVKVGNSRDSMVNNGVAKKRLVDKLDMHYNGSESKLAKKFEKIKKQKERSRRKSINKHQNNSENK